MKFLKSYFPFLLAIIVPYILVSIMFGFEFNMSNYTPIMIVMYIIFTSMSLMFVINPYVNE